MFAEPGVTGELLRELRTLAEVGLRRMAERTSFTPGYLSQIETGQRPVTPAVLDAYRSVLADPVLGLSEVDMARLQAALEDPAGAGSGSLADLSVILDRTRHLEDTVGAALVVQMVRGMDGAARALARHRAGGAASASLASEVARYRGWLEHATNRPHLADRVLSDAAGLAEEAEDYSQLAHARSFRAYTARHTGHLERAVDLTEAAISVTKAHPILGVYDRYQRAELLALKGDNYRAGRALRRADIAAEATEGIELPAFGYWYTPGFWGLERALVLTAMGRPTEAAREAEMGLAALPADHRDTDWARSMLVKIDPQLGP
ncbi:transcriptional regulator with XRE-family HTH domain [Nocardia goodfellowii]|uniref:Transcriptional regulator with XRE-family HTH domain n=1 Tax=Nocardia goodfellowii TaxID=882446 RepID=A0ABS4QQL9_9NOCA|nr:transcriptional regulator with XRE-family HTH domain [Nocardia goodfellowii]